MNRIKGLVVKLLGHDRLIKYSFNSVWLIGTNLVSNALAAVATILIARYLSPAKFGELSFWGAIVMLVQPFANLAENGIVTQQFTLKKYADNEIFKNSLALRFFGALLAFAIAAIYFYFFNDKDWLGILVVAGILFTPLELIESYYHSKVNAKISSIAILTGKTLVAMLKISLVYFYCTLPAFAFAQMLYYVLPPAILFAFFFFNYREVLSSTKFSKTISIEILKGSLPLMFSAVFALIFLQIDQVLIKYYLGNYDLGLYSAPVKISIVFYFVPILLGRSLLPGFIKTYEQSKELFMKRIKIFTLFLVGISYMLIFSLLVMDKWMFLKLFGEEYLPSIGVFRVLILALTFVFIGQAKNVWVIVVKKTHINLISNIFASITNIVLNVLFIPRYGIVGAAWATFISYFFAYVGGTLFLKSTHDMFKVFLKCIFVVPILLELKRDFKKDKGLW